MHQNIKKIFIGLSDIAVHYIISKLHSKQSPYYIHVLHHVVSICLLFVLHSISIHIEEML